MEKRIISLLFNISVLVLLFSCGNRTSYEIKGTAENCKNGTVVKIVDKISRKTIDSAIVKGGKFFFSGSIEKPCIANLTFGRFYMSFVLENAEYNVLKGLYYSFVDGGEINNAVYGFALEKDFQEMKKQHASAPDPFEGVDKMDKDAVMKAQKIGMGRMRREMEYKDNYLKSIIEGEYSSLVKLFALTDLFDWKNYGFDKKLELLAEYEKDLGKHPLLLNLRKGYLNAKKSEEMRKSISVGKSFKEAIGTLQNGEKLKLSEVVSQNKYTLLECWASWCGPCRGEFPHLKKAYKHYHQKGFEIFAISFDSSKKAWLKALKEENVPWLNGVDYKGFNGEIAKDYVIQGVPSSFLISNEGKIVASGMDVRGFSLDEKLKKLLGK